MIGMLAFSKAGHDKQQIYVVVAEDAEYVYLCDGRLRTIEHPKKKSKKHIQPVKKAVNHEIREKLLQGASVRNEEIKRAIKVFKKDKEDSDV